MKTLNQIIESMKDSKLGIRFIRYKGKESNITYGILYQKAKIILGNLQERGLKAGCKVVFQIEDEEEMLYSMWGCILGGFYPIITSLVQSDVQIEKIEKIMAYMEEPYVIVDESTKAYVKGILDKSGHSDLTYIMSAKELLSGSKEGNIHDAEPDDLAMIMYSSGSTGEPKGICVSHRNIYEGNKELLDKYQLNEQDVAFDWMPLVHMVGICFSHVLPLMARMGQVLVEKSLFLVDPTNVMQLASDYKASIMTIPTFGLKQILEKCDFTIRQNWDFSHIKLISCSGETVSYSLTEKFCDQMEQYELNRKAVSPLYGSTEVQVVSSVGMLKGVTVYRLNRKKLSIGDKVEPDTSDNAIEFTELGEVNACNDTRIFDDAGNELGEGYVGIIKVKGPSIAIGYYMGENDMQSLCSEDGWFDTGDIGFLQNKNLTIIGRKKEMIIINAVNYYLSDIEKVANSIPGIKSGNIAVCAKRGSSDENESVILFAESSLSMMEYQPIAKKIYTQILKKIGIKIDGIAVIPQCPRTETGKVDKRKLMDNFNASTYKETYLTFHEEEKSSDESISLTESKIIQIWITILGVNKIGVNQNFFQAGGDSVNAFAMLDKVMSEFNINLNIRTIYQKNTVHEFAKLVEEELNKRKNQ